MIARITTAIFLLIPVLIVLYLMTYIVREGEQAVITQFGKPVAFVDEPGLNFRIPLIQSVQSLEKRILPWDGAPENMQTRDKKRIFVDSWARWRIANLETFYTNLRTELRGQKILDDIVDSAVRDVIARHNLIDLVRTTNDKLVYESDELQRTATQRDTVHTGRDKIETEILRVARKNLLEEYGVDLVSVHIKRVNYDSKVRKTVYERMRSERERVARLFESEAEEERNRIKGTTQKELDSIQGSMTQQAEEIRGRADAEVIRMTADAYGKDPDFYEFLRRLDVFKKALKKDTNLILSTDNDLLRLLKSPESAPLPELAPPPKIEDQPAAAQK